MAFLLKHVDKTTVNYDTSFTYTIQASFNGLTLPEINPAVLVDTVPSYIELDFSAVDPVITYSVQTVGLNKVITFNFPPVTDTGIAYEIDLICKFKDGTLNGSTCTNNAQLYLAGSDTPSFTAIAPTVTLSIKAKWDIDKLMTSPVNNNPTPGGYAYYSIFLKNLGDRGAALNNFTIKDTLPAGMTLDPLFVPVVMNQGGGILNPNPPTYVKDPGDTGITWSITQYTGNNLLLIIKVNIDKNVALNTDLTNNVKLIDSEGNVLDYSNQTSKVTMTGVSKYGPNHSYAGALISYEIYIQNNGNALTNLVVIDTIPANVTIEKVFPGNFSIRGLGTFPAKTFHLFYTTDDYSVVNPSWTEIGVGFPYGYNPYWTYYNLPTTPNKVTRLKWEFPDADIDFTQSDAPRLNGVVDPTAEPTDTAVNVVNYYADQISPAQTDFTTYLDGVAEINGSKYNHPSGSVIPTDTINYEGFINAWASPIVNPIIVDLLPIEVEYIGNVSVSYAEYFSNQWVWTTLNTKYASDKKVKGALDTNYTQWPDVGNTYNGGPALYKLSFINISNTNYRNIEMVDILPHIGDTGVILNTTSRGSEFPVYLGQNIVAELTPPYQGDPSPTIEIWYSESYNPERFSESGGTIPGDNDWTKTPPSPITNAKSFKIITTGGTIIRPGQTLNIYVDCVVPLGVNEGLKGWNSFALRGTFTDEDGKDAKLLPVEPEKVGIQVKLPGKDTVTLGDFVWIDSNKNGVYDPGEKGQAGVVVTLYDENGIRTDYSAITDSNGKYLIYKVIPQKYYAVFSNIPQDYLFVTAKGYVTNTGVTPKLIDVPSGTFVDTVDAPIAFNDGLIGPPGLPGPSGCCYTYNNLNSIYLDNQEVKRGCTVNLGCSAVNNGEFSSYENNSNYVILNGEGTFMIDYSCYGEFLETPNEKDYIALQLKLNNDFILQGYSYTTENGVLRCR